MSDPDRHRHLISHSVSPPPPVPRPPQLGRRLLTAVRKRRTKTTLGGEGKWEYLVGDAPVHFNPDVSTIAESSSNVSDAERRRAWRNRESDTYLSLCLWCGARKRPRAADLLAQGHGAALPVEDQEPTLSCRQLRCQCGPLRQQGGYQDQEQKVRPELKPRSISSADESHRPRPPTLLLPRSGTTSG